MTQGIRRNTFSGDSRRSPEPGDFRDTREQGDPLRRALGEGFRDVDDQNRALVPGYPRALEQVYTEPMYLSLPAEPSVGIALLRIRKVGDEETPVLCGSMVHFWWDGVQSRAVITSIDGLTPDGSSYKFSFWVIG